MSRYILQNAEAIASAFTVFSGKVAAGTITLAEAKELVQGYAKLCHIIVDGEDESTFEFDTDRFKNLEDNWTTNRDACLGRLALYAKMGEDLSVAKFK